MHVSTTSRSERNGARPFRRRVPSAVAAAAAAVMLAVAVPAAANATVTAYANGTSTIGDQVLKSSTTTVGGNEAYTNGNATVDVWAQIRTSSGTLVASTSAPGDTEAWMGVKPASSRYGDCWWNPLFGGGGSLKMYCKIDSSQATGPFVVAQPSVGTTSAATRTATTTQASGAVGGQVSGAVPAAQSGSQAGVAQLTEDGIDMAAAVQIGAVDGNGTVWKATDANGDQCIVETFDDAIQLAAADCASQDVFAQSGVALEAGDSVNAPTKLYLLPSGLQPTSAPAGVKAMASTSTDTALVTVAPTDNSVHQYRAKSGKSFVLPKLGDWAAGVNHKG